MLGRRVVLAFALLLAGMGVIALGLGALGCGAAPAVEEATAIPASTIPINTNTPVATAILAPEPTPSLMPPAVTPDWAKLGVDTEAVIAFLSVPTPDGDAVRGVCRPLRCRR